MTHVKYREQNVVVKKIQYRHSSKKNFSAEMENDGSDTRVHFDDCVMCHGSSFKLIERVRKCIEKSKDLSIKPQRDRRKWKRNKMSTYYVSASLEMKKNAGSMRLAFDRHHMIIDYLYVRKATRSMGIGTTLINFARSLALSDAQNPRMLLSLATKESRRFWKAKGFVRTRNEEEDRLNPYDDTNLLLLI